MLHGIAVWLGLTNGGGHAYLWWSGFGANFGEYMLLGGLWAVYRRHNCHARRCWRIQRHPVAGTPYVTCRRHHPTADTVTAADIAQAHRDAQETT